MYSILANSHPPCIWHEVMSKEDVKINMQTFLLCIFDYRSLSIAQYDSIIYTSQCVENV